MEDGKPLTKKQKQTWDRILLNLSKYLDTAEGIEMLERMERVLGKYRVGDSNKPPVQLTENEERALVFIRKERIEGGPLPSVREVARAVGLRSSRSGYRILQALKTKGVLNTSADIL